MQIINVNVDIYELQKAKISEIVELCGKYRYLCHQKA